MQGHFIAIGEGDGEIFEPARSNPEKARLTAEYSWKADQTQVNLDANSLGMGEKADNPELGKASKPGLRIYSFPEYIYQESHSKTSIEVSDAPRIVCEGDEYPVCNIEKRPKFHFLFPHRHLLN